MDLLGQLDELGHLGELCRLASVFNSRRGESLTEREFIELSGLTAGQTFRYPRPAAALHLARTLGLVHRKGGRLTFTALGTRFGALGDNRHVLPSHQQGRMLLSLLIDDAALKLFIASALRNLSRDSAGRLRIRVESIPTKPELLIAVRVLQQCRMLVYVDGDLLLQPGADEGWPTDLFLPRGTTEVELLNRLDEQRRRGSAAELFTVDLERRRLIDDGRSDLAELVLRISTDDVGAGYDIRSFDADGSTRYIEVKSSVGRALRFEWSSYERREAEKTRGAYWIYFVPLADDLAVRPLPVLTIQDPIGHILAGHLEEVPTHFVVNAVPPMVMSSAKSEYLRNFG